ncbi:MAG: LodA/GoxA family CTQ-dependent oxidase [Nitrospirales bacterium]|nr:LodA/GoxA family CTQ-dependent oxidase [Nitrospirales bacterium]
MSKPNMPKLFSGLDPDDPSRAEYAALTNHQYSLMQKWAEGNFIADWNGEPQVTDLDDLPLEDQPAALTRAALEACIGAPFFPGIEGTYVIAQAETYIEPFRIDHRHPAGFLTERMALPWQADFIACGQLWWPAQRPVEVTTRSGTRESFSRGINDYADMVRWWTELGFVVQRRGKFVESERNEINGQS